MTARFALAAVLLLGCSSEVSPGPVTRLELHAVPMVVEECNGDLTNWTVHVRETGEQYNATCDQPIVLTALVPYESYTLEISGYARRTECWQGACAITPLPGLGLAECAHTVTDVCNTDAGGP